MTMKWACPIYGGGRVVWCGACPLVLLSTSEVNWCNEGCRGEGEGEAEKGGEVTLHTDRSLLASHMITHMHARTHTHTGRYT